MPTIQTTTSVASGASATPLVGSQFEYLKRPARVEFAILGDTGSTFNASVFSGSDVLMQNQQVDTLAVATPIQYPYNYPIADIVAPGDRLGVTVTNAGGATATVRVVVRITYLG